MDNKALLWPKNTDLNFAIVIGVREGGLYKVSGKFIKAMIHDIAVLVNCGIGGLIIFISKRYLACRRW